MGHMFDTPDRKEQSDLQVYKEIMPFLSLKYISLLKLCVYFKKKKSKQNPYSFYPLKLEQVFMAKIKNSDIQIYNENVYPQFQY